MALKTDFEDSKDIASPFVDEVANPGPIRFQTPITRDHADKLVRANKTNKIVRGFLDSKGTKAKKQ
jgi:hypothetical protein